MGLQLWENLLLGRVLPSITSTISALVIVLVIIRLCRIRNPQTRYLLLHLPMLKGLVLLIRGVPGPVPGYEGKFRFGFQLMDPLSVLSFPNWSKVEGGVRMLPSRGPEWDATLVALSFFAVLALVIGILVYRWVALAHFYRRLLSRPAASLQDAPALFRILDRLVPAFGVRRPRVVLAEGLAIGPCTVGVRPATIVLPKELIAGLGEEQLEAVLAHELAHVSRRDGIWHWPSLLLRDLQSFNPVAHRLFNRAMVEREKDSDRRAARATGQPRALAQALVEVALLARGAELRPAPGSMSLQQNLMGRTRVVEERVSALLANPVPRSRLRPVGLTLLLLFLVFTRIWVHFPAAGYVIMIE